MGGLFVLGMRGRGKEEEGEGEGKLGRRGKGVYVCLRSIEN